jgi:hypothetical protein
MRALSRADPRCADSRAFCKSRAAPHTRTYAARLPSGRCAALAFGAAGDRPVAIESVLSGFRDETRFDASALPVPCREGRVEAQSWPGAGRFACGGPASGQVTRLSTGVTGCSCGAYDAEVLRLAFSDSGSGSERRVQATVTSETPHWRGDSAIRAARVAPAREPSASGVADHRRIASRAGPTANGPRDLPCSAATLKLHV